MRVGIGVDAHRFAVERPLVIGGLTLEYELGLAGHSDADVLCHAIGDALLGAAGLGDLGTWFPSEDKWEGVSSLVLLDEIRSAVAGAGWRVVNVDATVIAEAPKLAPHITDMTTNIARAIGVQPDIVSIKATTTDGMGFTGRGEGIASLAVASLERASDG
ncbi:MAG: 2-C-methyl-D-erythritol 2,4-cyclodiphosphate synthase [Actinomycetota bacterium]